MEAVIFYIHVSKISVNTDVFKKNYNFRKIIGGPCPPYSAVPECSVPELVLNVCCTKMSRGRQFQFQSDSIENVTYVNQLGRPH